MGGARALKGLSRPRLEILNWHLFTTFDLVDDEDDEDEEDDWYRQLRQLRLSALYMIHGDDSSMILETAFCRQSL